MTIEDQIVHSCVTFRSLLCRIGLHNWRAHDHWAIEGYSWQMDSTGSLVHVAICLRCGEMRGTKYKFFVKRKDEG